MVWKREGTMPLFQKSVNTKKRISLSERNELRLDTCIDLAVCQLDIRKVLVLEVDTNITHRDENNIIVVTKM